MIAVVVNAVNVFRVLIMAEALFCIGFFLMRVWLRRRRLSETLSIMAIALLLFSIYTVVTVFQRLDKPLIWRAPILAAAITVTAIGIVREFK